MIKSSRELQLENVLERLIERHFFSKELEWCYVEGARLKLIDKDLWEKINDLIPYVVNRK